MSKDTTLKEQIFNACSMVFIILKTVYIHIL